MLVRIRLLAQQRPLERVRCLPRQRQWISEIQLSLHGDFAIRNTDCAFSSAVDVELSRPRRETWGRAVAVTHLSGVARRHAFSAKLERNGLRLNAQRAFSRSRQVRIRRRKSHRAPNRLPPRRCRTASRTPRWRDRAGSIHADRSAERPNKEYY